MKKILVLVLSAFLLSNYIPAQEYMDYSDVKLETEEDFVAAEGAVQNAVQYILSNPGDVKDIKRFQALQLIMTWMEVHPSYLFQLESVDKLGTDMDAKAAYIAAVAKYYFDNKGEDTDSNKMKLVIWKTFLGYAANPENNIKSTKTINKLIMASHQGDRELLEALN